MSLEEDPGNSSSAQSFSATFLSDGMTQYPQIGNSFG